MEKRKKKIIVGIALLLSLLFGIVVWQLMHQNSLKEDIDAVGYDPKIEKPEGFTSEQIALPGFSEVTAKEGDTIVDMALANPSFNSVYFKYIVTFDNTGETLLESDLIAPGKAIKELPIPKDLSVGKYPITISIKTYNKKTKAELNGGANQIFLVVEK